MAEGFIRRSYIQANRQYQLGSKISPIIIIDMCNAPDNVGSTAICYYMINHKDP